MKLLTLICEICRKFPSLVAANAALLLLESALGITAIFSVAPIIDFLVNPNLGSVSSISKQASELIKFVGLPATLSSFFIVFLAFNVLKSTFSIFARYCLLRGRYAFLRNLGVETWEDMFRARWLFFSSNKQGSILNTFVHEIWTVLGDAFGAVMIIFAALLQLLFYFGAAFYLSWQVTSIGVAAVVLAAVPFFLLGKINYRLGTLNTSTANAITAVIHESLGLAKVILGFGNEQKCIRDFGNAFDAHRRVTIKFQILGAATQLTYGPLGMVVLVLVVLLARELGLHLSETAIVLLAFRSSIPLMQDLMVQKNNLAGFYAGYEQLKGFRQRARELGRQSGNLPFTGFHGEIAVENLTFSYPGHEPTLVNINLRIPKGKVIAIVGESGAGKSTLIDMIMGLNEPLSGRITFDGTPLQAFDISSYRRRIGYVPQDNVLFNMSIRDNLRWAKEGATDAEIKEACRLASADEFIERFPDGYDTVVGDRGVRLSVGQCQRVALARAILRKPELLVLDEATSSVDSYSERMIQRAIENISKDVTVVIIAHRFSTIMNADVVYVLQGNTIVEKGTYQELVRKNDYFSRMARLQQLETAEGEMGTPGSVVE